MGTNLRLCVAFKNEEYTRFSNGRAKLRGLFKQLMIQEKHKRALKGTRTSQAALKELA